MSRIGSLPVQIPGGVTVTVTDGQITVKGPKGELKRALEKRTRIEVADQVATVARDGEDREARARHGLMRADLNNMVVGVSEGFEKRLVLSGVGYRAQMTGSQMLNLSLGFSHPVDVAVPEGVEVATEACSSSRIFSRTFSRFWACLTER
ncbi:MAG: 50S ribosomal protein L6 [Nitrospinota bacterium]